MAYTIPTEAEEIAAARAAQAILGPKADVHLKMYTYCDNTGEHVLRCVIEEWTQGSLYAGRLIRGKGSNWTEALDALKKWKCGTQLELPFQTKEDE